MMRKRMNSVIRRSRLFQIPMAGRDNSPRQRLLTKPGLVPPFSRNGDGQAVRPRLLKSPTTWKINSLFIHALLMLLLIAPPFSSSGRVFMKFSAHGRQVFDTTAGWQKIYRCSVLINSSRAELSVYGCDEPPDTALARLKHAFPQEIVQEQNTGWMTINTGDKILRLLAPAMPEAEKCVIFALEQTPDEYSKSLKPLRQSAIFGPHSFPGGELSCTLKNEADGTILETMYFNSSPEKVAGQITSKLSGSGWRQILPPKNHDNGEGHSFLIFKNSSALCTVMIAPALRENRTCVTFTQKEIKEQNR